MILENNYLNTEYSNYVPAFFVISFLEDALSSNLYRTSIDVVSGLKGVPLEYRKEYYATLLAGIINNDKRGFLNMEPYRDVGTYIKGIFLSQDLEEIKRRDSYRWRAPNFKELKKAITDNKENIKKSLKRRIDNTFDRCKLNYNDYIVGEFFNGDYSLRQKSHYHINYLNVSYDNLVNTIIGKEKGIIIRGNTLLSKSYKYNTLYFQRGLLIQEDRDGSGREVLLLLVARPHYKEYILHSLLYGSAISPQAFELWIRPIVIERKKSSLNSRLRNLIKKEFIHPLLEAGVKVRVIEEDFTNFLLDESFVKPITNIAEAIQENKEILDDAIDVDLKILENEFGRKGVQGKPEDQLQPSIGNIVESEGDTTDW